MNTTMMMERSMMGSMPSSMPSMPSMPAPMGGMTMLPRCKMKIALDKYPLSPRLKPYKSALAKLDPASAPKPKDQNRRCPRRRCAAAAAGARAGRLRPGTFEPDRPAMPVEQKLSIDDL